MKHALLFYAMAFFFHALQAQEKVDFLSSKLIPECPPEMEFIRDNMKLTDVSYTYLATGIDTLDVMIGELTQRDSKGYWVALMSHKNMVSWQTISLFPEEGNDVISGIVDIDFNEKSHRICLSLSHDRSTNEVYYHWLKEGQSSIIASVQKLDLPIQKNKEMPFFKVESLAGEDVSSDDFKGKFLVINWWATSCRPCIVEMPGLNELAEKYRSRDDVRFIAIARDERGKLEDFLSKREFKYEQNLFKEEVLKIFGNSYPKHIIVNPDGMVTYFSEGGSAEVHHQIEYALKSQLK
jgi:peroxiredoxin